MDRTDEYTKIISAFKTKERATAEEHPSIPALKSAKELRMSLRAYSSALEKATTSEYLEIEKVLVPIIEKVQEVLELLEDVTTEENFLFVEGVKANIKTEAQNVEMKLENRRSKRRRGALNVTLEPERAPSALKSPPVMMQMLYEENERILENVRYTEKEVMQVRRKISEIDTLQKLITQEIFTQDERIDIVMGKSAVSYVDVKISRTYIKNAGDKRRNARRFLSLLILIFSIMILLLHLSS